MPPLIRWQWLWESRWRVLAFGLGLMALGGLVLAFAFLVARHWRRRGFFALVILAVGLIGGGGYEVLKALFSPAGAFGYHHDTPITPPRRKWRRSDRGQEPPDDPIPLADDPPK